MKYSFMLVRGGGERWGGGVGGPRIVDSPGLALATMSARLSPFVFLDDVGEFFLTQTVTRLID